MKRTLFSLAVILAFALLPQLAEAQQPVVPMCGQPPAPCTLLNPLPTTGVFTGGSVTVTGGSVTAVPTTGTGGQNPIDVTSASGLILAARTAPQYALAIKNEATTATVAVCFGAACTAALNTKGSISIPAGWLWSASPAFIPLDQINGISNMTTPTTSPVTIQSN